MATNNAKFWVGLILRTLSGLLIAREAYEKRRMPNAKVWQQTLSEKKGEI